MKHTLLAAMLAAVAVCCAALGQSGVPPSQANKIGLPLIADAAPATTSAADGLPPPTAVIDVASVAALQKAIDGASPGDRIVVADGVYDFPATIVIGKQGTQQHPIVIAAQTVGGVEIRGGGGFKLESPAAYVVIQGFKFTYGVKATPPADAEAKLQPGAKPPGVESAPGALTLAVGTRHCRFTRNVVQLAIAGKAPYLVVAGDDHEIDHNTFQNKHTEGQMISVQGPGRSEMAQRTWIHHNYFHDFPDTANNCAAIQVGLSGRSMSPAFAVVEYNLFSKCAGENEGAICNKSCDNIYRFNTFAAGTRELSVRHGNRCQVYGNFFIGSEGIRFYGHDHKIYSNYFTKCRPAISIGNGDAVIPPGALTSHDRPDGVEVTFNTLVDNRVNVIMAGRGSRGLGANNLAFANNIIQGGGKAVAIGGPLKGPVWEGNILWANDGGPGDIPADGFSTVNPQLKQTQDGVFRLQPGSPAIGKAVGPYAYVTVDIDGQPRGATRDVGADQLSNAPVLNRVLTSDDVGPNARKK